MSAIPQIALLYFHRSPRREAGYKRWLGGNRAGNLALAHHLHKAATQVLQDTGFSVIDYPESLQRGATFGERLSEAFQSCFAQGYAAVIAVGSDCMDLSHIPWQQLPQLLKDSGAVLGPDRRGGSYLVGLRAAEFDAAKFAKLPWQSAGLYKELCRYFSHKSLQPHVLPTRVDVHRRKDLLPLLQRPCLPESIRKVLLEFFLPRRFAVVAPTPEKHKWKVSHLSRRGPPR